MITFSRSDKKARLWDVNTGEEVACVLIGGEHHEVALSRSASVFAVGVVNRVRLFDWSGAALGSIDVDGNIEHMQFTPCGKYIVLNVLSVTHGLELHQYDVATLSCVRVFTEIGRNRFVISPCSRIVVFPSEGRLLTRHLYPE